MSALIELYIAIVIIYLFECVALIGETTVLIYSGWFRFKVSYREAIYKWSNKLVKFLNPFLPHMDVFKADFPNFSISPEGISSYRANDLIDSNSDTNRRTHYNFSEIELVNTQDESLYINKNYFIKCNSILQAEYIKTFLTEFINDKNENYEQKINDHLTNMFNLEKLKEGMDKYNRNTFILSNITFIYWIFLFLILPVLLFSFGFYLIFEKIIIVLIALHMLTIVTLIFTQKSLYKNEKQSEFKSNLIKVALSPLAACRSMTLISEEYLLRFHPIVIMKYLLPGNQFIVYGNKVIREYLYINQFNFLSESEKNINKWYREKMITQINEFIKGQGYNIEELLKSIQSLSKNTLSYCPRCLTEYSIEKGNCSDCNGINLISINEIGNVCD